MEWSASREKLLARKRDATLRFFATVRANVPRCGAEWIFSQATINLDND